MTLRVERRFMVISPSEASSREALARNGPPTLRSAASDDSDVLRLLALAAGRDVELDALPLLQRLVTRALDARVVDKDIVAALAGNEAEALFTVEELHGTCDQRFLISRNGSRPCGGIRTTILPELRDL
jgi:hypothetical protein